MDTLGARLKSLRGDMSAKKFGEMFGTKPANVYRYESNSRKPSSEFLTLVAKNFGISVEWLVSGEIPSEPTEPTDTRHALDVPVVSPEDKPHEANIYAIMEALVAKYEAKMDQLDAERRELSLENRQLFKEKETLLRENGDLRIQVAALEQKLAWMEKGGDTASGSSSSVGIA